MAQNVSFNAPLLDFNESSIYGGHVDVPLALAQKVMASEKRVVCTLNDQLTFHCGLIHNGKGGFFINVNKAQSRTLAISVGDVLKVVLSEDTSKYGINVSEVFLELLDQDPEGADYFHGLTRGKQRSLIHVINQPKQAQLRLEKAFIILDYLKEVKGKLDFKELKMAFVNSRFRN